MASGEQFVGMVGTLMMPELCADSLVFQELWKPSEIVAIPLNLVQNLSYLTIFTVLERRKEYSTACMEGG
jgi:hypothetical protein